MQVNALIANWRLFPLQDDSGTTSALQALYNNKSLRADVISPDSEWPSKPILTNNGLIHYWYMYVTPNENSLFIIFDGNPRHLRVLEDLQIGLNIYWLTPTYRPYDHIVIKLLPKIKMHKLISQ